MDSDSEHEVSFGNRTQIRWVQRWSGPWQGQLTERQIFLPFVLGVPPTTELSAQLLQSLRGTSWWDLGEDNSERSVILALSGTVFKR